MRQRALRRSEWLHRWVWVVFDAAIWFVAIYFAAWAQFDFGRASVFAAGTLAFAAVAVIGHLVVGPFIGPSAVGHRRGSFEETTDIGRTVVVTMAGLVAWALIADPQVVPRSVPVVGGTLALVGMFAVRFLMRSWRSRHTGLRPGEKIFFRTRNPLGLRPTHCSTLNLGTLTLVTQVQSRSIANHEAAIDWMRQQSTRSVQAGSDDSRERLTRD